MPAPQFPPPSHRYGKLTYLEIQACIRAGWPAVVPTGCTEQQGPHLPVDWDTWFAEEMMVAVVERAAKEYDVNALVLPAVPFGPTPEHVNYGSGYIDIPVTLHEALYHSVLDSLAAQGFRQILLWRGCGGHDLHGVVQAFNQSQEGRARAFLPDPPFYDIWCRLGDPEVPAGHADSFTTAITMHRRPEAVRRNQVYDPQSTRPDWEDPDLDLSRYSSSGVIGDPTHSDAELGAQLWEAVVSFGAELLRKIAKEEIER